MPLDFLPIDTLNDISRLEMKHSIHSLTDLAKANSVLRIDRTLLASEVSDRTNDAVQCFSIEQLMPVSASEGIEAAVRNKLIKALTSLEDNYGVLDKLGVSVQIAHSEQDANAGVVLNINNEQTRESASEKIAWKIIVPILTALAGAILGAAAISYIGLG